MSAAQHHLIQIGNSYGSAYLDVYQCYALQCNLARGRDHAIESGAGDSEAMSAAVSCRLDLYFEKGTPMEQFPHLAKSNGEQLAPEQLQRTRIPVQVYHSDSRLMVALLMPGLQPEDITVAVHLDGRLIVAGRRRGVLKGMKEVLYSEWSDGEEQREVALAFAVDGERANVTYDNGVVVVALPLSAETRPALLTLERVGRAVGQHVGSTGQTLRPTTTAQHQAALRAHRTRQAEAADAANTGASV
jgi:HSP20 family protein